MEAVEDSPRYTFPAAAQPDIIRANQKDVYYQGYILEHLETLVQNLLGSRWLHSHQPLLKAVSDGLYLGLTTAIGLRTLGEEYTDIYQIESATSKKPSIYRRVGYVFAETAGWYILTHILWPRLRRRLQKQLEKETENRTTGIREKCLRASLAVVENTTSLHLALFYFLGTYYSLPKRLFRIRYMFTRRLFPGEQRPGYELLGLLLFLQIATQSYLSLTSSKTDEDPIQSLITSILTPPTPTTSATPSSPPITTATTTIIAAAAETTIETIDLEDPTVLPYIPPGARRCPLCLDPMKDPTAAECGHLFCWTCILRWTNESVGMSECPICRGRCGSEGLLRLAG